MRKLISLFLLSCSLAAEAQITSCASFLKPKQKSDVIVPFRYADEGVQTPLQWGLDLAWLSEANVRTGILYAGKDMIDVVRLSFQPTASVVSGEFSTSQLADLDSRISIVKKWCKSDIGYYINDDNPSVDSWYNESAAGSEGRAQRWAKLIDMTIDYYKSKGLTNLLSICPFNEPDNTLTGQGYSGSEQADFKNICKVFKTDEAYTEKYAGVRLSGGNTLNTDYAYDWWNYAKDYLDEGNTHQLAGTFDNYASFFQTLVENGDHATNDELHNVMECMVGAEYGLQTGIWWGTCEYARSQFMKATYHRNPGSRLAYAEHRGNWTSASVYRQPDGAVQAFGGMSERQSYTTNYNFVSLDRPVWYDGERGRDYLMYLPGGTGYRTGQSGAEVCVNVQGSHDVMPHIGGTYKIINVNSGMPIGFSSKPTSGWTSLAQRKNNNTYKFLQWVVTPLRETGDFSYYTLVLNTDNGMYMDLRDWNYNSGADVGVYPGDGGVLEQWFLEYAGNGAFYIRNRYSAKYLEVADAKTTSGANVQAADFTGEANQQWRFIATNVTPDLTAPDAPANLTVTPQGSSIKLTWDASVSKDVTEYVIVRNGYALAKGLTECEFTDNEAEQDSTYAYAVYAIDKSLNYSSYSNVVEACQITDEKGEVLHLTFDETLNDETLNGNHCAVYGDTTYLTSKEHRALSLSGTDNYIQLPYTVASHDALTISCWVYYRGGNTWQRLFDFGNGTDQYLFLTTNCGNGPRFAIRNGGEEQRVNAGTTLGSNRWHHLAVTLEEGKACLYVNGVLKGTNENLSIKPSDIRPTLNYIGRSQFAADPLMRAYVDDFVVYNYALSAEEVQALTDGISSVEPMTPHKGQAYDLSGRRAVSEKGIIIRDGKKILK